MDAILHVWNPKSTIPGAAPIALASEPEMGQAIPEGEIKQRSRSWRSEDLAKQNWKVLSTPNSMVRGDVHEDGLRTVGVYVEELNVMLRSTLGGSADAVFSVRVFKDQKDFCRYATCLGASNAESLYDPRSAEMAFWFHRFATPELFGRSMAHEFTHAYMDRIWRRTSPLWFAEGLAEYFSNTRWQWNMLVPGFLNSDAVALLKEGPLDFRKEGGLQALLETGRVEMYGARFQSLYAFSWSFVHFLVSRQPSMIQSLLRGELLTPSKDLEAGWFEHIQDLIDIGP